MSDSVNTTAGRKSFSTLASALASTALSVGIAVFSATGAGEAQAAPTDKNSSRLRSAQPVINLYRVPNAAPMHMPGPEDKAKGTIESGSCVSSVIGMGRKPSRSGDYYEVQAQDKNGVDFYQGYIHKDKLVEAGVRSTQGLACTAAFKNADPEGTKPGRPARPEPRSHFPHASSLTETFTPHVMVGPATLRAQPNTRSTPLENLGAGTCVMVGDRKNAQGFTHILIPEDDGRKTEGWIKNPAIRPEPLCGR